MWILTLRCTTVWQSPLLLGFGPFGGLFYSLANQP